MTLDQYKKIFAAVQALIAAAPMGDDDQLYIADVMQPEFDDLLRAMPEPPLTLSSRGGA